MAKRWKVEDDVFLVAYADAVGANYVANHDLGFKSKDAGVKRINKLIETGLDAKIHAYLDAKRVMHDAWTMEFGPEWAKEIVSDMPWTQKSVDLAMKDSL